MELKKSEKEDLDLTNAIVLKKEVSKFGSSGHVVLGKKLVGEEVYIIYFEDNRKIWVHADYKKKEKGKTYLRAETSDAAGTHSFWIEEKEAKKLYGKNFLRDPKWKSMSAEEKKKWEEGAQ